MKAPGKPMPPLRSDAEAERFVKTADLSEYDLSGFKPMRFEIEPKAAALNMRLPTALLATGITILASLSFFTGLILDTVVRGRREVRRLAYLAHPAPGG